MFQLLKKLYREKKTEFIVDVIENKMKIYFVEFYDNI